MDLTKVLEQVSGSDALREQHNKLVAAKTVADEAAMDNMRRHRAVMEERQRLDEHYREAQESDNLQAEALQIKRVQMLQLLEALEQQRRSQSDQVVQDASQLRDAKSALSQARDALRQQDAARSEIRLQTETLERRVAELSPEISQLQAESAKLRSFLEYRQRKGVELDRRREREEAAEAERKAALAEVDRQLQQSEQELAASHNLEIPEEIGLSAEQKEELARCEMEIEKRGFQCLSRLRGVRSELTALREQREAAESGLQEMTEKLRKGQSRTDELEAEQSHLARDHTSAAALLAKLESALRSAQTDAQDASSTIEALQQTRREKLQGLQRFAAQQHQLERDRRFGQVTDTLKSLHSGVFGRVIDLCKPAQARLQVAVNVALASYIDAVIVDSAATATKCIAHLKANRCEPMTFLPLRDLRYSQSDPRIAGLREGTAGIQCVVFDETLRRAFEFMLADVVVVQDLTVARRLAYDEVRGARVRFISMAGETVLPNGNMSVDASRSQEGQTRFDLQKVTEARRELESIDQRIAELRGSTGIASDSRVARVQDEIRECKTKMGLLDSQSRRLGEELGLRRADLEKCKSQVAVLTARIAELADVEKEYFQQERTHDAVAQELEAEVLGPLAEQVGCSGPRALLQQAETVRNFRREATSRIDSKLARLRAERTALESSPRKETWRSEHTDLERDLRMLDDKQKTIQGRLDELAGIRDAVDGDLSEHRAAEKRAEDCVRAARSALKTASDAFNGVEQQVVANRVKRRAVWAKYIDLAKQVVVDDQDVPLLAGSQDQFRSLASADATAGFELWPAGVEVDLDLAVAECQAGPQGGEKRLEEIAARLEELRPNLKAIERLRARQAALEAMSEGPLGLDSRDEIQRKLVSVRRQRQVLFTRCFSHVSREVDRIYRHLTGDPSEGYVGGAAYLDAEDPQEPYAGGIRYTTMPPAKRVRELELQSGGERTLAALALLFALQSYRPPPFMILDEVDAALDPRNAASLVSYLRDSKFQTAMISLRQQCFQEAEVLFGIWKDRAIDSSKVVSWDLRQYSA
mmetsp:Transcript_59480/g.137462  ORF Transcript_59480/g.137462 Transcript_59480/m.137462 type:complete len:1048 (-) Transcript_59480:140-3283(-)